MPSLLLTPPFPIHPLSLPSFTTSRLSIPHSHTLTHSTYPTQHICPLSSTLPTLPHLTTLNTSSTHTNPTQHPQLVSSLQARTPYNTHNLLALIPPFPTHHSSSQVCLLIPALLSQSTNHTLTPHSFPSLTLSRLSILPLTPRTHTPRTHISLTHTSPHALMHLS